MLTMYMKWHLNVAGKFRSTAKINCITKVLYIMIAAILCEDISKSPIGHFGPFDSLPLKENLVIFAAMASVFKDFKTKRNHTKLIMWSKSCSRTMPLDILEEQWCHLSNWTDMYICISKNHLYCIEQATLNCFWRWIALNHKCTRHSKPRIHLFHIRAKRIAVWWSNVVEIFQVLTWAPEYWQQLIHQHKYITLTSIWENVSTVIHKR